VINKKAQTKHIFYVDDPNIFHSYLSIPTYFPLAFFLNIVQKVTLLKDKTMKEVFDEIFSDPFICWVVGCTLFVIAGIVSISYFVQ